MCRCASKRPAGRRWLDAAAPGISGMPYTGTPRPPGSIFITGSLLPLRSLVESIDKGQVILSQHCQHQIRLRKKPILPGMETPTQHASAPKRPALLTCLALPFLSPGFSQEGPSKPPVRTTPHDHNECRTAGRLSLEEGLSTSKKHVRSWKYKGCWMGELSAIRSLSLPTWSGWWTEK